MTSVNDLYKHNVAFFLVQLLKPHKLQRLVLHYNREISILQRLLSWLLHKWKVQLDIREGFYLSTISIKTILPHLKESGDGCNHTHCPMWLHPLSVASPSDSSSSGLCRQQFWYITALHIMPCWCFMLCYRWPHSRLLTTHSLWDS